MNDKLISAAGKLAQFICRGADYELVRGSGSYLRH
jgi:hypothetical protein